METLSYKKASKETIIFFEKIIKKSFPILKEYIKINYTFRTIPKLNNEGNIILAESIQLSNHIRDIYQYDFEICIYEDNWKRSSRIEQKRLAWHELNHLVIMMDDSDKPKYDSAGRIKIALKKHNISFITFLEEIETFGLKSEQKEIIKKIQKLENKKLKIKRR